VLLKHERDIQTARHGAFRNSDRRRPPGIDLLDMGPYADLGR
jgi:hypothetical protein